MSKAADDNDEFYEQLRLHQLYGTRGREGEHGPITYKDPTDGNEYEWDQEKKAWFPKITEDLLVRYQANYGLNLENDNVTSTESAKPQESKGPEEPKETPKDPKSHSDLSSQKAKGEKRKADPGWFNVDQERNTNVYVTGLPLDITNDEFVQIMSKYGIIMRDPVSEEYKIKLYKDGEGNLKGDGLCCYLKRESVDLALKLLDEYEIRGYKLHVESAKFQLKGQYDASKKKKKSKDYRKKLSQQQKLLDWRPEKKAGDLRKRFERVVIIRNMFHPKDFEEDPLVLNEIREDLRTECEKFGQVKKVLIFDRHPDGVASVSFKEAEESDACILALNGRWFGGRQLVVEPWDGVTDYQIEETSREREERLKGWDNFLQTNEQNTTEGASHGSSVPCDNGQTVEKQDNKSSSSKNKDNDSRDDDIDKVDHAEDDSQSTDSNIGSSDDEADKGHL